MSDMSISPNFKKSDWNKLSMTANDSSNWSQAVAIFKDRIHERYLKPIEILLEAEKDKKRKRYGFIIMSIDCLLIETLGSFCNGETDTEGKSKKVFSDYLVEADEFKLPRKRAKLFYIHFRCGLLHLAEVKSQSKIRVSGDMIKFNSDEEIIVNRMEFHRALINSFDRYCKEILAGKDKMLRENFIKKMDFICRL